MLADERSVHTHRWVQGMRGLGHRVDLITLIKDFQYDIGGISLDASTKLSYLLRIGKLRKLVGKLKPDILHSHYASSFGFLASFVDHPRKILSVWGNDIVVFPYANYLFKMMVVRSLRKANRVTATSYFLKNAVSLLEPGLSGVIVIPFGIDPDKFVFSQRPDDDIVTIGIAKSLRPKYGIDILIKAFKISTESYKNIRLSIAGRGNYADKYKSMVRECGLSDLIDFVGFIDYDKLPEFFSKLDIFAMPSISDGESFGVAALEASASGVPVVATRVGGVPEVVLDGKTGFLVERKNVDELARALEKLITNPELRRQMGKAGREFVEKNYRWEDNLKSMENLYFEMMK